MPGDPDKQAAVRRAYESLKNLDASRPVVDNSGWSHVATDLVDWHVYDETPAGWAAKVHALLTERKPSFPVGLGPDMIVDKLLMADGGPSSGRPNLNSEFGGGHTSVERGWNLRWQTLELRRHDTLSGYVWTELYDVEHEMAGVYTFGRGRKDSGGNAPDLVNADTVLLVDIDPRAPGRDLVVGDDRTVDLSVRISHHGASAIEAVAVPVWGTVLGDCDAAAAGGATGAIPVADPVKVHPFQLSAPFRVIERLPDDVPAARLHLLIVSSGEVIGRSYVDVGIDAGLDAGARAAS